MKFNFAVSVAKSIDSWWCCYCEYMLHGVQYCLIKLMKCQLLLITCMF